METITPLVKGANRQVLVLYWSHPFEAVEGPAFAAAFGLANLGYSVSMGRIDRPGDIEYVAEHREAFEFCIAVGSVGLGTRWNGKRLYELLPCRTYFWTLDPIFHDLNRVSETRDYLLKSRVNKNLYFLCPDRDLVRILNPFAPGRAWYFPFGGFYTGLNPDIDRHRRIAVVGTIGSELAAVRHQHLADVLSEHDPFSMTEQTKGELCLALQAEHGASNVAVVLREFLRIPPEQMLDQKIVALICAVDSYEKRRRRLAVVAELVGVPTDFYGLGWERYIQNIPGFAIMGAISHTAIADVVQHYAVVLNFDPNWDDGVHDRTYTALGSGCRVITNINRGLPAEAVARGDLLLYDMNMPKLRPHIQSFMQQPAMSQGTMLNYRSQFSWTRRMDEFVLRHRSA